MKFVETLKNIWKISELKDRIFLTMSMLLVYRFGAQVVLPGIDSTKLGLIAENTEQGILGLLNALLGVHLQMLRFLHWVLCHIFLHLL